MDELTTKATCVGDTVKLAWLSQEKVGRKPGFHPQQYRMSGVVVHACGDPNTWELKQEAEVQVHPWLPRKFEECLEYLRHYPNTLSGGSGL